MPTSLSAERAARLGEAIGLGTVDAVASIIVPTLVAPATGLVGMAVAWLAVQSVIAVVAAARLRRLTRDSAWADTMAEPAG